MKMAHLILVLFCGTTFSFAQNSTSIHELAILEGDANVAPDIDLSNTSINYAFLPVFSGYKLQDFFEENINYNNLPDNGNLTTNVYISFVVQEDGRVSNFAVPTGDGGRIESELIRIMKLMPQWEPGTTKDGYPLNVHYKTQIELNFPGDGDEIVFYTAPPENHEMKTMDDNILDFAEKEPSYPGGPSELNQFIIDNINLENIKKPFQTDGVVFVQFIVRKNGEITDAKIIRSQNNELDQEAIRIIKKMPKWEPASQAGKPVSVKFILPIKFRF